LVLIASYENILIRYEKRLSRVELMLMKVNGTFYWYIYFSAIYRILTLYPCNKDAVFLTL